MSRRLRSRSCRNDSGNENVNDAATTTPARRTWRSAVDESHSTTPSSIRDSASIASVSTDSQSGRSFSLNYFR